MASKVTFNTVRGAYSRYNSIYTWHDIHAAYGRPSSAKCRAWERCKSLCRQYDGYGLQIIGANCHTFSAGFKFIDENGVVNFMWITPTYDRYAEVEV